MNEIGVLKSIPEKIVSFFDRPQVKKVMIPVGKGVPMGIERISSPKVGIGGAYGTWGESYDNDSLPTFVANSLGEPLSEKDKLNLSPLGFVYRHHVSGLTDEENLTVEIAVGSQFLREAAHANGWEPEEIDAILIGASGLTSEDYIIRIAKDAGIPENALKVSVHKACDSSVGALHLALNPNLPINKQLKRNLAEELAGKKVLVGGIEGLSHFVQRSHDKNALQLFGNGVGIIGVVPGKTMEFVVGKSQEVFDEQGVLAVHMYYPHSKQRVAGQSLVEVNQAGENYIQISGLMHEPEEDTSVVMAGPMGMVKLFVRSGVQVVQDVYQTYQEMMKKLDMPDKTIAATIVHHANLKINQLKEKHLHGLGVQISMPWVLSEFGNVSAASNMIAFLRQLPSLNPGDHILIDGFGAGTYYDALVVALGGQTT
jgi:3-oxoacyl-[acyl-carrier-protein] synthase III